VGDDADADVAAGAGAVVDDHRTADGVAEMGGNDPRHDVGRTGRGERHHDLDGTRGIAGRARRSQSNARMPPPRTIRPPVARRKRRRDGEADFFPDIAFSPNIEAPKWRSTFFMTYSWPSSARRFLMRPPRLGVTVPILRSADRHLMIGEPTGRR